MKIVESGKLFDENLRHPVSAYYVQRCPGTGFFDVLLPMFGFSF